MKIRKAIRPTLKPETDWNKVKSGDVVKTTAYLSHVPVLVSIYEKENEKIFSLFAMHENAPRLWLNRKINDIPRLEGIYTDVTLITK